MGNLEYKPSKRAAPLVATAAVIFMGAMGMSIMIAAGGGDPLLVMGIFGGIIALLIAGLWLLRGTASLASSSRFGWVFSRDARPAEVYIPKVRRQRHQYGNNLPPTVEDVKEAKDGLHNWVPSKAPRRQRR